jgi:hypothetical protein
VVVGVFAGAGAVFVAVASAVAVAVAIWVLCLLVLSGLMRVLGARSSASPWFPPRGRTSPGA